MPYAHLFATDAAQVALRAFVRAIRRADRAEKKRNGPPDRAKGVTMKMTWENLKRTILDLDVHVVSLDSPVSRRGRQSRDEIRHK